MLNHYSDDNYEFYYPNYKYTNSTNPETEIMRYEKFNMIKDKILNILNKENIVLKSGKKSMKNIISNNLSMFIAVNLLPSKQLKDPFFPNKIYYSKTLIETIKYLSDKEITLDKCKEIYESFELEKEFEEAISEIREISEIGKIKEVIYKNNTLKYKNYIIKFPSNVKDNLYKKYKKNEKKEGNKKRNFFEICFCLLLRYKTFGGETHQLSMEKKFKDEMRKKFNIDFELFASAVNSYYTKWCSLFYDIEKYFGSYGNFYHLKLVKGFYIANPPYETLLLEKMTLHFVKNINESKKELSISFGLPNWGKYGKFKPLDIVKNEENVTYKRLMRNGEVWWHNDMDGNKIMIPSHYKVIIQNKKGKKKWNIKIFDDLINKWWVKKEYANK